MRQSDYGLDLLVTIIDTQLKETDFAVFDVADALEVIKTDIMEEIRQANRGCPAADLVFYFGENFPQSFTQGACRRKITAILETIEGGGAEYLEYLDEYIQDYQERYAGDGGSC